MIDYLGDYNLESICVDTELDQNTAFLDLKF